LLQQSLGEHDLDDLFHGVLVRPAALELDGERDPGYRLRAGLQGALDTRANGVSVQERRGWDVRRAAKAVQDERDLVDGTPAPVLAGLE
jgi:hypothetical protein